MSLGAIIGGLGSGKTLLMTYIATKVICPIYANYRLDLPTAIALKPSMLPKLDTEALVLIDEAYLWLESRESGRDINKYMSYILFESRKRSIDILVTVQLLGTIDLRFRELSDFIIMAERLPDGHSYTVFDRGRSVSTQFFMSLEVARKLYPLYDTLEIVMPSKDFESELTLADPDDMQEAIESLINEMLNEAPLENWDRGAIADFVLEKRYPNIYAEHLWNRVKRQRLLTKKKKL